MALAYTPLCGMLLLAHAPFSAKKLIHLFRRMTNHAPFQFYPPDRREIVGRRKSCTIRLGDKTGSYEEGDIVLISVGKESTKKTILFPAFIDQVVVKPITHVTAVELAGENRAFATWRDLLPWLATIYGKDVTITDLVTVIHFSEVIEGN